MGFFSNIKNFVERNVKSTIKDSANLVQQYLNNPVTSTLAPTALSAIGVPPEVGNAIKNLQNKGLDSLQGKPKNSSATSQNIPDNTQQIEEEKQKQAEATKKINELEKIQQQKKKKNILIISGAIVLTTGISIIAYKLLKNKN